jgi:hypothetical protein
LRRCPDVLGRISDLARAAQPVEIADGVLELVDRILHRVDLRLVVGLERRLQVVEILLELVDRILDAAPADVRRTLIG